MRRRSFTLALRLVGLLTIGGLWAPRATVADAARPTRAAAVFVSPTTFETLRAQGAAVLDARDGAAYMRGHVPGAVHAPWEDFVDGPQQGALMDDLAELGRRVRALGIDGDRPVLVYGAWRAGWGEEGRIAWMLRYLGHRDVHILEGGFARWRALGKAPTGHVSRPRQGHFAPHPQPALRATTAQVEAALAEGRAILIDTREAAEYAGATPYGSPRGGHLPGARSFPWRQIFDPGRVERPLPAKALRARLAALGVGPHTPVIVYCTGGVRSGLVAVAMEAAGLGPVRNYDASFWEWSSRTELPLVR